MLESNLEYLGETIRDVRQSGVEVGGCSFFDCRFIECSFAESALRGCSFVDCSFKDCDLTLLRWPGTRLSGVLFEDCKLIGVDWTRARWSNATAEAGVRFVNCVLNHSTFIGLDLPGLSVLDCLAVDVDYRECTLVQADFSGTDLSDSLFSGTDLSGADLRRARGYSIDVARNNVTGARFALPEALALLYSMDIDLTEV